MSGRLRGLPTRQRPVSLRAAAAPSSTSLRAWRSHRRRSMESMAAVKLALSLSLNHELAGKGVRVQAVLPGATATEFWDIAGLPVRNLPTEIVMAAENLVDAALAGLDQGEVVTIPSLPDKAEWDRFDAARRTMSAKLTSAVPARRYNIENPQFSRSVT